MYYRLSVVKVEDNPAFDPVAVAEFEKRRMDGYGYRENVPDQRPTIETRQLDVVLNDDEYEKVKQGVIALWR